MKSLSTFSRGNLDTGGSDQTLLIGGQEGIIFTAVTNLGLTLKIKAKQDATNVNITGSLVGLGLGYGDELVANGTGSLILTFWGNIDNYFQIVNTDQLEVVVGSLIEFAKVGTVGGVSVTPDAPSWLYPGIYTDYSFSIATDGRVTW